MRPEDLILVSVDDHVVEPPDLFQHHLTPEWKDRAPRVVQRKDGTDVWVFEGQQLLNIGLNAVAGRPPEEYGVEPTSFEQLRPGCYDLGERVRDMNANGVLGSLCFPSFPSFCGALWARTEDKQLAITMLRAYNDWHIDEWCGGAPGRFIPLALPVMWDADACADEVRRVARKGCHALSFTENPEKLGFPSLHDPYWDPVWRACSDEGTIVCIHIGSAAGMQFTTMDSPVDVMITVSPISIVSCAADLVWSQVLRRFPKLKFALSEGGIGWIPYFLERIDYVHRHHHRWTHQDFGGKKPSELFREHIVTCFIDDPVGVQLRHEVGIETITWECDYPHSDTTWPTAPEQLAASLDGVPEEDVAAITWENAVREFRFDPFAHRSRDQCTVAALRAESPDVDLTLKSQGGQAPIEGKPRPVTAQDITSQLAQIYASPAE
ncbi:MAG: amidohydrolase family protein [Myxococcota bacterium]